MVDETEHFFYKGGKKNFLLLIFFGHISRRLICNIKIVALKWRDFVKTVTFGDDRQLYSALKMKGASMLEGFTAGLVHVMHKSP